MVQEQDALRLRNSDVIKFGEIIADFRSHLRMNQPQGGHYLLSVVWIGGGMGARMGIIDFQFPFLFLRTEELGWEEEYLDSQSHSSVFVNYVRFPYWRITWFKVRFTSRFSLCSRSWNINDNRLVIASRGNWSNQTFMTGIWMLWTIDLGNCWCKPACFTHVCDH